MDAPSLTPEISEIINSVVSRVVKCVAVIKVYLFGSYYSGTYNKDSDIDIAFFIKSNETLIDAHRKIIKITSKYPVDIQPQVFYESELDDRVGIVEEILENGVEIDFERELE
ncbi:MAG: nucleotidyltransferase domain-containing protein [Eubacteriales bacterium]|nr:nucleotidyltransferase domain-containing protein [Eubacteriales bacterium]